MCPNCKIKTFLSSYRIRKCRSKKCHNQKDRLIYICPQCKRYVNVHPNTHKALGVPGDEELRIWRKYTHLIFDQLWLKNKKRKECYNWLAHILDISPENCHIGMFSSEQCKKAIEASIKEMAANKAKKIKTRSC